MNLSTFSFSRLLLAGLFFSLVTMIVTGCNKNDNKKPPTAPLVATAALTNVTSSGATAGGSIVSDGGDVITQSGIVWSKTNATPTLADSVIAGTTANGTFTNTITGLDFNTSYYIRAYATNAIGTGYGNVVTLNTTDDTSKVRFTYNGEEVVYGIIISPTTGKKWLDRNLGADQVATASDDYKAYGDLFQWGRPDDGHQLINWTSSTEGAPVNGTTETLATSDIPGHSNFIIPPYTAESKFDWRDDNNSNRWAINSVGPCPAGWHVPTRPEWAAELKVGNPPNGGTATSGGVFDRSSAYDLLKLTFGGYRKSFDGSMNGAEVSGDYWTSTNEYNIDDLRYVGIQTTIALGAADVTSQTTMAWANSVRCIKDN
jgi:uncharacterized protein (TIGR02145 family)